MRSLVLNQKLVLFLLASDFPSENPRTQNRTILIRNVGVNAPLRYASTPMWGGCAHAVVKLRSAKH